MRWHWRGSSSTVAVAIPRPRLTGQLLPWPPSRRPAYVPARQQRRPSAARGMASTTIAAAPAPAPTPAARFSAGTHTPSLSRELEALLRRGRWALVADGEALERSFRFKTFAKTWDFMTAVSLQCKIKNHHPEWSNVYNLTYIRWTTHSPKGLSAKDVDLAAICDDLARDFGEIEEEGGGGDSHELRELADSVATTAGSCCVPTRS